MTGGDFKSFWQREHHDEHEHDGDLPEKPRFQTGIVDAGRLETRSLDFGTNILVNMLVC